jgi:hypothetical protein
MGGTNGLNLTTRHAVSAAMFPPAQTRAAVRQLCPQFRRKGKHFARAFPIYECNSSRFYDSAHARSRKVALGSSAPSGYRC